MQKEHIEQKLLIRWFRMQYPAISKCLFAIPNGGVRHIKTALKLKEEGVLSGVSDLFLMMPKGNFHGMFIEMKAEKGKIQPSQQEFLNLANSLNYKAIVCFGFENAKQYIQNYLQDQN